MIKHRRSWSLQNVIVVGLVFAVGASPQAQGRGSTEAKPPARETATNKPPRLRLQVQAALTNASRGAGSGNVQFGPTSPDGRLILALGNAPGIWDAASSREIRRFDGVGNPQSGAFSPDGRLVALGLSDRTARLLDPTDGREIRRFGSGNRAVGTHFVAFSPDGTRLVTDCGDGTRLWEIATGRLIQTFALFRGPSMSEASLAKMAKNYGQTPEGMQKILSQAPASAGSVIFSADNRLMLAGLSDGSARLLDVASGKETQRFLVFDRFQTPVSLSADGREATTNDGSEIRRWDVSSGQQTSVAPAPAPPRTANVRTPARAAADPDNVPAADIAPLMFSPDGRWLVTAGVRSASDQRALRVWDTSTGQPSGISPSLSFREIAVSSSRIFASGGRTPTVWDIGMGQPVPSTITIESFTGISISGRRRVVPASQPGSVQVIDIESGRVLQTLSRPDDPIKHAVLSPDDSLALTIGVQGLPRVWDVETGKEHPTSLEPVTWTMAPGVLPPEPRKLDGRALAFSKDSRYAIVVDSPDQVSAIIRAWDIATGRVVRTLDLTTPMRLDVPYAPPTEDPFNPGIALCTTGCRALILIGGTQVRIYDFASGREIRRADLAGRLTGASPLTVSMSADEHFLLVAGRDDAARLIEIESGKDAATIVQDQRGGWAVVTPDGRFDTNMFGRSMPMHWVDDDDPFRILPIELFARQFYTPRLLADVLARRQPARLPDLAALNRAQPEVSIAAVEPQWQFPDDPVVRSADMVTVTVKVKETIYLGRKSGVHDVRLFRDGQLVAHQSGAMKLDADGGATMAFPNIHLPRRGPNVFSAYAFNADRVKSQTAETAFKRPRATTATQPRAYVVAIGVNVVAKLPALTLRFAVNDARGIAEAMRGRLEQQGGYAGVDVALLVSDTNAPGASKGAIRDKLKQLAGIVRPEDFVLVSFSGHGYTDDSGQFHIFPSDIVGSGKSLPTGAISTGELTEWLRPIDAKEMVLLLDACHSAAGVEAGGFKAGPMGDAGLGQLAYDKKIRILAATQSADVALEHESLQKGLLSFALVDRGLNAGEADWLPKDGAVKLGEWLLFGVNEVPMLSEQIRTGKLPAMVVAAPATGAVAKTRGLAAPQRSVQQKPALFDFADRGDADIVVSRTGATPARRR